MIFFIRSLVFNICFIIVTIILSLFGIIGGIVHQKSVYQIAYYWSVIVSLLLKHICHITYEITGKNNLPKNESYIFACKHQSAWETVMFQALSAQSVIIVKRELFWIPIFGQVVYLSNAIGLNRKKGKSAIQDLISKAQKIIVNHQPIFIFPEGTRSVAGQKGHYKRGIGQLYSYLKLPVIPAALNSGEFWPRRGFIKYPGHIVVHILPQINPGLEITEFMNQLSETIENACLNLPKRSK